MTSPVSPSFRFGALVLLLLPALAACGPRTALGEMEGGVLFYRWPHGAQLEVEEIARIREKTVRGLRELEDFSGNLEEWRVRTDAVTTIRITPEDLVYGSHFFVYYLAALDDPAVAPNLEIRILRIDPDGTETWDHLEFIESRKNRRAQSGGLLFSMYDLAAGEYRLRFEFVDGTRVSAAGELKVDYQPAPSTTP